MSRTITIQTRMLARHEPLFADWSIPYPPDLTDDGEPVTLRDLIARIVTAQVEAFRNRQGAQQFLKVLTRRQIETAIAHGKVISGQREIPPQPVDVDQAVGAALQAFEDRLYLVAVDDQPQKHLDDQVYLRPDSHVRFIRLTLLAGG